MGTEDRNRADGREASGVTSKTIVGEISVNQEGAAHGNLACVGQMYKPEIFAGLEEIKVASNVGQTAEPDIMAGSKTAAGEEQRAISETLTGQETVMRVGQTGEAAAQEPRRDCRKCLTREMGRDEYFHSLHEYIANLDADLKVSPAIYEARLAKCKQCGKLLDGMCRICGCYVELRAAMKKNRCPLVHPAWERVREEGEKDPCTV